MRSTAASPDAADAARVEASTAPFRAQARDFPRGSWIVTGVDREALADLATRLGIAVAATTDRPAVATRPVARPRLALLHTWLSTQTEGWWRQRLDLLGVPYDYISTQDVAATADLARAATT